MTDTTVNPSQPVGADGKPIALPDPGIVSSKEMYAQRAEEVIAHLESTGFPSRDTQAGKEIWDAMEGRTPVTPAFEKLVRDKLEVLGRDAAWRGRLFAGDAEATKQFHIASAFLAAAKAQRGDF